MKERKIKLPLISTFLGLAILAHSQGVVSFSQYTLGGGSNGKDQVQGWEFIPTTDLTVLKLGLYDGRSSGGFKQSHEVAVWDRAGNLIASTLIPQGASASLLDNFRYEEIPPVQLDAGETYVIGEFSATPVPDYHVLWERSALTNGIVSLDPRIEFVAYREGASPGGISFPQSRFVDYVGCFGPNFIVDAPEPSSFTLLCGMGAVSLVRILQIRGRKMPPNKIE
jgi:hypothetical protein